MAKCSFCRETIEPGTGKMFVTKDGRIIYFCSTKCEKHMNKLKRNPRNMKWVRGESK